MKRIVEAMANGEPVGAVLIDLIRIWPFKAPTELDYLRQGVEEFYLRSIKLPANAEFIVRESRPGDPTDY